MAVNSGTSTMTITITNTAGNTVSSSGVALSDTLPSGMTFSTAASLGAGCVTGTLSGTGGVGTNSLSMTGATVATGTPCVISASVTSTTAGTNTNTTGNVSSTNGGAGGTGTANIIVNNPPTVTKTFAPTSIGVSGTSTR